MNPSEWQTQRKVAEQIWRAGLNAVDSTQLVKQSIRLTDDALTIHDQSFSRAELGRVLVVGAGKAGAGMAAGVEAALPSDFLEKHVTGWVNVPADCLRPLKKIHLHPARPAGINEPTILGVQGTEEILSQVSSLEPHDLCLVLISGGGSALLPAPAPGVTLDDKLNITRNLAKAGATIEELNTVRSSLSRIKAGGLLRACTSKNIISLIISDVVGDPLETIASGPTINTACHAEQAMQILQQKLPGQIPDRVIDYLSHQIDSPLSETNQQQLPNVSNIILGSNAVAVQAAARCAEQLGYRVVNLGSSNTGIAKEFGVQLIEKAQQSLQQSRTGCDSKLSDARPVCIISGGETVVPMSPDITAGKGGRNQEIALAALAQIAKSSSSNICLLCAGTDGEDGPTDAAGAFADAETLRRANQLNLDISDYLNRHDSYHFFQPCNSLLITGPTHTNVMDLCVTLVTQ